MRNIIIRAIKSSGSLTLMMETERLSETLGSSSDFTRLIAREDFIAFIRRESF
jgi:hypothetical protein